MTSTTLPASLFKLQFSIPRFLKPPLLQSLLSPAHNPWSNPSLALTHTHNPPTRPESFSSARRISCDRLLAPIATPKEALAGIPLLMIIKTGSKIRNEDNVWGIVVYAPLSAMMFSCNICTTSLYLGVTRFSPGLMTPMLRLGLLRRKS
jgi:hypothetical protein